LQLLAAAASLGAMTDTTKILNQLRVLTQLTQTEAQIAQIRAGQARTDAVRRELLQNADNAADRTDLLLRAVRDLGGVRDVVTPALGRVSGVVKAALEQPLPVDEALLQDLALEHQLLDRARYVKVLAEAADLPQVVTLADRLVEAHTATVEWLTVVLAEEALGGPTALRATPLQRVAGGATRVVNLPARYAAETVNRTVEGVQVGAGQTRARITTMAGRASQLTGVVRETLAVGRNASLQRAEELARRDGSKDTARTIHDTRRNLGALRAEELPIKGYDALAVGEAVKAIKRLKRVEDVQTVINYEEAHAARRGAVSAAQVQVARLAKEAAGIA